MKKVLCRSLVLTLGIALVASAAFAKRGGGLNDSQKPISSVATGTRTSDTFTSGQNGLNSAAAPGDTTELYSQKFDAGGVCNVGGWIKSDATIPIDQFWHVTDFATANVNPDDSLKVINGDQSLWCGAEASITGLTCGYLTMPGYGNDWVQVFQTKNCIATDGTLDVSVWMEFDSEEQYDATFLEYTTDCTPPVFLGWQFLDGDIGVWDNRHDAALYVGSYASVPDGVDIKVRLRFQADGGWSDEDALWDSRSGPVVVDDLQVEGLALEDFEGEALNAETTEDWEGFIVPGYGQHMALYSGLTQLQEDECDDNLSCQWAALENSSETYSCGGFPTQTAVPKGNGQEQYIYNEVMSPPINIVGAGSIVNLQFGVYRDLPLDNLVFYTWGARGINELGCELAWRDRNFVYRGEFKDYLIQTEAIGDLVLAEVFPVNNQFRVKVGVRDMCGVWCGSRGTGDCHSHAPLLDNVRVYRVEDEGPVFFARDLELFQDTFPTDGTDTGTGRADAAVSWQGDESFTNIEADSATFICLDPLTRYPNGNPPASPGVPAGDKTGLAPDLVLGQWQCYTWVYVEDSGVAAGPAKSGVNLQQLARNPFKDTQVADGKTWTRIRMGKANNDAQRWRIDLPDALFEAGDVIYFFFAATNTDGITSYQSGSSLTLTTHDVDWAAANASEFSILPGEPGPTGTDILYVDGMDGRGAQQFWDNSFASMGLTPDRYDIRAPSSLVGNHPGSRIVDVQDQLNGNYKKILWDCGNLNYVCADGQLNTDKSDDFALINSFLGNLTTPGGVYIGGDDQAEDLAVMTGGSAATFKSVFITYTVTSGNARPTYGISPTVTAVPGGIFDGETWLAYGGCPAINDFDVLVPTGSSDLQSTYGPDDGDNGADISQSGTGADPLADNRVLLSGYGFQFVKADDLVQPYDRDKYLYDILIYLENIPDQPTDVKTVASTRLEQNYPNPFNPSTTIAFALKERGRVKIDVYNVAGQLVKTLLDETRDVGAYTNVNWNGTDSADQPVSSGVYFYKLVTSNFSQTKKMVLLK